MFSRSADYALRALVFIGSRAPQVCTTGEIAIGTKIPKAYLTKILQSLIRGNFIVSRRGGGGGLSLAKDPKGISVLDVVNHVSPIARFRGCPLSLTAHGVRLCALHRKLDDALAGVERALSESSLSEMIEPSAAATPRCPFPRVKTKHEKKGT